MSALRYPVAIGSSLLITLFLAWMMKVLIEVRDTNAVNEPFASAIEIGMAQIEDAQEPTENERPELPEMEPEVEPVEEAEPDLPEPATPELEPVLDTEPVKVDLDLTELSPVAVPKARQPVVEKVEKKEPAKPKPKPTTATQKSSSKSTTEKSAKRGQQAKQAAFNNHIISRPAPVYPAAARQRGQQGYVTVSYSVLPSGQVTNVRVVSASPPGVFNSAALDAVRRWRYAPQGAAKHGITKRIRFVLR